MALNSIFLFGFFFFVPTLLHASLPVAAPVPPVSAVIKAPKLSDRLSDLRKKIVEVEGGLLDGVRSHQQLQSNVKKIQLLLKLQKEERELGRKRMAELEKTIGDLEQRRGTLHDRISGQQDSVRKFLMGIRKSKDDRLIPPTDPAALMKEEKLESPRRKMLANLVGRGFKELEALRVDMADADHLELKIQDEKQQLVYLFQDLNEQEGVLELNKQLQVDLLQKKHEERLSRLENYRKLKSSEAQVEKMLVEFNARLELEQVVATERAVSKAMMQSAFAKLKGTVPFPISSGRVVGSFGRTFDPKSGLYVFKKGVDISASKGETVKAVAPGRIAYSGELPDYGRVTIVDHGDHFYTLCAHLGELGRKKGEAVKAGDPLGKTDDLGTPVYFEIRARNVAVNPLQWLSN